MANKKGGLGRGLNSLLGGEAESTLPKETTIAVENEPPREHKPAVPVPPAPKEVKAEEKIDTPSVKKTTPTKEKPKEDVYVSKEDNITIKGVVERAVQPSEDVVSRRRVKSETQSSVTPREVDEVPIDMVEPNPNQPRTNFKKEELEELAESIKRNGLLQPILVRKVGDKYQIIAGERRWQACKKIGLTTVPVRIRDVDDEDTIVLALVENIQRSDLNPIEEAYGYRRMMERSRMTQTQIAQAVSKGRSTIANALRLLDLPEDAQQLLFEEKITAGHARAILSIPTAEGRAKLTEKLVKEQLSVRETEAIARLMSSKKDEKKVERTPLPKSYKTVARSLSDTLQADVRVKSIKGKNRIEIAFKDEADLERLFRIITSE